jgi:hypothetical protein
MTINHHNYEEYFILYLDNELGIEDRRMVEIFVQHNPDLKEELDVLLQSRLIPDNSIIFEGKDELIKMAEGTGISMSNYEEWLVLYMDNELSPGQKVAVEKFVAQYPVAKAELDLFSKTKLQPEKEIAFPGKESLYKRTEKVRVIPLRWWRVAAAILILFISITAVVIMNNRKPSTPGKEVATNPNKEQKTNTENPVVNNKENKGQSTQPVITQNTRPPVVQRVKQSTASNVPKQNNVVAKQNESIIPPIKDERNKEAIVINHDKPSNNLPRSINLKVDTSSRNIAIVNTPDNLRSPKIKDDAVTKTDDGSSIKKAEPEFASFEEGNNKNTRGFFRKVVRLFTKTTKINPADDDDRVMIGGLAVKLK